MEDSPTSPAYPTGGIYSVRRRWLRLIRLSAGVVLLTCLSVIVIQRWYTQNYRAVDVLLHSSSAESNLKYGYFLVQTGRREEAIPYLRKAVTLSPVDFTNTGRARAILGKVLCDKGETAEGSALLRDAERDVFDPVGKVNIHRVLDACR